MNTYSEEPDGFILYDERPDPFDNRRASRTRFAAVNLPILLGISAVSALLLWITQSCLGQCGINRQVGGAVHVFAIALYGCCTIKALGWKSAAMMPERGIIRRYGCSELASYLPPSA